MSALTLATLPVSDHQHPALGYSGPLCPCDPNDLKEPDKVLDHGLRNLASSLHTDGRATQRIVLSKKLLEN